MGVMLAAGWAGCGVPYAIVLGLVVGAFCAVPYLGGVGIPLAVVFLAFKELGEPEAQRMAWWGIVLWPTLVFGVVQFIEGYVLTPMIAGKATNLDPVTILVVVLAGGSIMGVYGMLLAIPVAACLKILCTDVLLPKVRAWTAGEAQDPLPIDRD
jgi:predicted PurR-regulated permease PerM